MPNIETANSSIFYEFAGNSGSPILLLSNSLGTSLEMWDSQMEAFTRNFRVLRYDLRGHGKSFTPTGPYSIEDLASDVRCLLDALQLKTVHFCGLSIGGVIGQYLTARSPARLDKVVLCNTAAKIGTSAMWDSRIASVRYGGMSVLAAGFQRVSTPPKVLRLHECGGC